MGGIIKGESFILPVYTQIAEVGDKNVGRLTKAFGWPTESLCGLTKVLCERCLWNREASMPRKQNLRRMQAPTAWRGVPTGKIWLPTASGRFLRPSGRGLESSARLWEPSVCLWMSSAWFWQPSACFWMSSACLWQPSGCLWQPSVDPLMVIIRLFFLLGSPGRRLPGLPG